MLHQSVIFAACAALLASPAWADEATDDDILDMAVGIFKDNRMYASEFHSQVVPTEMDYGSWYQVSVAFKNTGAMPWMPNNVRLINAGGSNFGISEVPLANEVGPGGIATFNFSIRSECSFRMPFPYLLCVDSEPDFTWMMANSSGGFGPASPMVKNVYEGHRKPPAGRDTDLPPQPAVPMIDLTIPFAPPPKDPPAPYRAPDQWKQIQW